MALWRGGGILRSARLHARPGFGSSIACRAFAENAVEKPKDVVKEVFIEKLELIFNMLREFRKFRIVIDPDDPKAVKDFADNIEQARKNIGLPPQEKQLLEMMRGLANKSKSVRDYYQRLGRLQASKEMEDVEGNQAMLDVVDAIEKKIGRVLTKDDKEGMKLFEEQSAAALKRLDRHPEKLDEYVEQSKFNAAKYFMMAMKEEARETIARNMKEKEEIKVDFREIDARNFLRLPGESLETAYTKIGAS